MRQNEIDPKMLGLLAAVAFGGIATFLAFVAFMWQRTPW
jgi:hypothetical protein